MSLPRASTSRTSACLTSALASSSSAQVPACPVPAARRNLHATASASAKPRKQRQINDPFALRKMQKFQYDDVPTLGHLILQRRRELLKYFRLAEHELPKLEAFRQPYNPPDKSSFLRFRFQHYQGEEHPASRKVVLSVPVSTLFETGALRTPQARHKFLLLAGSRYDSMAGRKHETQQTASDGEASNKSLGEVNISCELMPSERQNMKWCSDVLDKLIEEANSLPDFSDVPLDPRHELARESKRRGFDRRGAASIADFPKEWL